MLIVPSEEIFDFSSEKMTTHKTTRLKNQFCQEFSEIFQLCTEVLEKAQIESLISATLETTLRFLSWVPLGYIFGTNIVALLHERVSFLLFCEDTEFNMQFFEVPMFRNVTLKCINEIGGLELSREYDDKFVILHDMTMASLRRIIPLETGALSLRPQMLIHL